MKTNTRRKYYTSKGFLGKTSRTKRYILVQTQLDRKTHMTESKQEREISTSITKNRSISTI